MTARTPRTRTLVFTVAAALLAALGVYRWVARDDSLIASPPRAASLPSTPPAREGVTVGTAQQPATGASPRARDAGPTAAPPADASPQARLTPSVFDFATIGRETQPEKREEDDPARFPTNAWFTRDDQRHPERYFELAERMPELNRPEERRDTLEYFRRYRDKLQRDLDAAGSDRDERQAMLATIARYDRAIARLGHLIETERPADARRPER